MKDFPIGFCRTILRENDHYLLGKLSEKFKFEICIGYNGKIWIQSERINDVIFIMNALERYVEYGETEESAELIMKTLND